MDITFQEFVNSARIRMGNPPSDCELTDATILEANSAALRDLSRAHPANRQSLLIWLQPYQEYYILPFDPDYVFDLVPAAPTTASARAFGNEFRALELDLVDFHISDLETFAYRVSQYREMFEVIEWTYDTPPTLYVTPSPVQAMQAIVIVGSNHDTSTISTYSTDTLADVPTAFYEILMDGTMGFAFRFWANQRNSPSVLTAPASIGSITLENGRTFIEESEKYLKRFYDRLGFNRPQIAHG